MQVIVLIHNKTQQSTAPISAKYCDTFSSRFRGLMFQRTIDEFEGLILKNQEHNVVGSTIHMMFMFFDIAVIWISEDLRVVDKAIAKRWGLLYAPVSTAMYTLELHKKRINDFNVGDSIEFHYV